MNWLECQWLNHFRKELSVILTSQTHRVYELANGYLAILYTYTGRLITIFLIRQLENLETTQYSYIEAT
jgi:hypothetical protein